MLVETAVKGTVLVLVPKIALEPTSWLYPLINYLTLHQEFEEVKVVIGPIICQPPPFEVWQTFNTDSNLVTTINKVSFNALFVVIQRQLSIPKIIWFFLIFSHWKTLIFKTNFCYWRFLRTYIMFKNNLFLNKIE